MTPIQLVDDLIEFIKPVVADFELDTNVDGVRKAPQVISGYLPEKQSRDPDAVPDYPHVIVRYLGGEDGDGCTASIVLIIGTYSEDNQDGWRDNVNVLTRVKQALKKQQTIGAFRIQYPLRSELFEEQPFPQWVSTLSFDAEVPQMLQEGGDLAHVL